MSLSPFLTPFKHHVTLPLWHQGKRADQNQHTLPLLSPMTHTYIKDPSKWIYIRDSNTQPSGFTHFDSATQPSGFTSLSSPYMTEYYTFTSWVSTRPFHQIKNMNFMTNTRKTSRKISFFRINIMPTMHYTQQGQCSPWICASKHPFHMTKAPP